MHVSVDTVIAGEAIMSLTFLASIVLRACGVGSPIKCLTKSLKVCFFITPALVKISESAINQVTAFSSLTTGAHVNPFSASKSMASFIPEFSDTEITFLVITFSTVTP